MVGTSGDDQVSGRDTGPRFVREPLCEDGSQARLIAGVNNTFNRTADNEARRESGFSENLGTRLLINRLRFVERALALGTKEAMALGAASAAGARPPRWRGCGGPAGCPWA